jgi:hypothetical protein
MSRTGSVKHIHQYFRRENGIWHCSGIDECTHYVPRNMPPPVGRKSRCWGPGCDEVFQLTPVNMQRDKPLCDACSNMQDILIRNMDELVPDIDVFVEMSRRARGASTVKSKVVEQTKSKIVEQKDEIEVIEADEQHAPDCDVFRGMDCSCR